MNFLEVLHFVLILSLVRKCLSFSSLHHQPRKFEQLNMNDCGEDCMVHQEIDRRLMLKLIGGTILGISVQPNSAFAKTDCMADCLKNCKQIAPKVINEF